MHVLRGSFLQHPCEGNSTSLREMSQRCRTCKYSGEDEYKVDVRETGAREQEKEHRKETTHTVQDCHAVSLHLSRPSRPDFERSTRLKVHAEMSMRRIPLVLRSQTLTSPERLLSRQCRQPPLRSFNPR